MAIRSVLRLGDPLLLSIATEVNDFNSAQLDALIEDMFDTMEAENGAGLAAPQIGVGLRVVIFGFDDNPRYPDNDAIPLTVLINPKVTALSEDKEDGWEGCLSVPGMRGVVSRYSHIRYTGYDAGGNQFDVTASRFHARVVQHECDHLDGVIYTQRLSDPLKFGFTDELMRSGQLQTEQCAD